MGEALLVAELVYEHADSAVLRLHIAQCLCHTLCTLLVPRGLLSSRLAIHQARRAWNTWRRYSHARRSRARIHSWIRRRVRDEETPVLG